MNKVLAIVLLVAVAAQAKVIPELVDRIALFPDMLKTLGLDQIPADSSSRIVNGAEATPHSVPWQVAITIDGSSFCGGSIISTTWVLTAAHCGDGATSMSILAGAHDRTVNEATQRTILSSRIVVHPNWAPVRTQNDVAVVQLRSALTYSSAINKICLATTTIDASLRPGQTLTVTGWGKTGDGPLQGVSNKLNTANLAYAANTVCTAVYGNIIIDSTLCCSGISGTSTCNGDSGGPLTEQQGQGNAVHQVGVVSFGSSAGCAQNQPIGFARVASFYSWITTTATVDTAGC